MKPEIFILGRATSDMRPRLDSDFIYHEFKTQQSLEKGILEHGEAIKGILNIDVGVSADVIKRLPQLQVISCYGVGYDSIDIEEALLRKIVVSHTPSVLNADVANTAIMLLLAISRDLRRDDAYVRDGLWEKHGPPPLARSIEGAKVGLVGMGRIGQEIAKKCQAFNCDISYHSRTARPDLPYTYIEDLKELATLVSYLIAIVPGGQITRHLINKGILQALGSSGTFINVSRGSVVDEEALIEVLENGELGYAGLDVYENEPYVPATLRSMDQVVLLPHVASATRETRRAMADLAIENLLTFFAKDSVLTPVPECRK